VAAAFAVICAHVAIRVVEDVPDIHSTAWWAGNLWGAASRWGVDAFIMASGALLLDPSKEEPLGVFYRKRAARVLIPLLFWSAFYLGLRAVFGSGLTREALLNALLTGKPYYHLWYLFMIPGLYFYTPFLRRYIGATPPRERRIAVASLLALAALYTFFRYFYRASVGETAFTLFVPYVGLFLAGYEWRAGGPPRISARALWGVILLCWAAIALGSYPLVGRYGPYQGLYLYDRLSPFNIAIAMSLFALFYRTDVPARAPAWVQRAVARLYPATFGIYLIHPLWLTLLERLDLITHPLHPAIGVPLIVVMAYLLAYLLTRVMLRIPALRRTVC